VAPRCKQRNSLKRLRVSVSRRPTYLPNPKRLFPLQLFECGVDKSDAIVDLPQEDIFLELQEGALGGGDLELRHRSLSLQVVRDLPIAQAVQLSSG
jgi:hypothetical protein